MTWKTAGERSRRRYVNIGPRGGWCGHMHVSVRSACQCQRRWDAVGVKYRDRWLTAINQRVMPTGERLRYVVAMSGRPLPVLPLEALTDLEVVDVPRGVRAR